MKNNLIEELKKLDERLKIPLKKISMLSKDLKFRLVGEFEIGKPLLKEQLKGLGAKGIYMIKIHKSAAKGKNWESWIKDFEKKWNHFKIVNGKKRASPILYKSRIKKHKILEEWIPLYIGKSKELTLVIDDKKKLSMGRIEQHYNHDAEHGTYSLKLNARKNLSKVRTQLSVIDLDVNEFNTIAPIVESALRCFGLLEGIVSRIKTQALATGASTGIISNIESISSNATVRTTEAGSAGSVTILEKDLTFTEFTDLKLP